MFLFYFHGYLSVCVESSVFLSVLVEKVIVMKKQIDFISHVCIPFGWYRDKLLKTVDVLLIKVINL